MSGLGATLGKQVGPMPLGAWLLVGAGGLFIAWKSRQGEDGPAIEVRGDTLPTGGGYPSNGATNSFDGAPVVLSPVFNLPAPKVEVNVKLPDPTKTPTPATPAPAQTPRVPSPAKTAPRPAPAPRSTTVSYTVKSGDTLWGIAARFLGSGLRWPTIYAQNKATIEAAAKRHGKSSSGNGHWIYPGTTLRITK